MKGPLRRQQLHQRRLKENKKHEKKYKGKFEWFPGTAALCIPQKKGKYKDAGCRRT